MNAAATVSVRWRAATVPAGTDAWATPPALYMALDREFDFTLDAAAGAENAKHVRFFDREADALGQSWSGERVFCNPPYGRELEAWLAKAHREAVEHGTLVVMLLPARTDTRWFHDVVLRKAHEIRFIRGRLKYRRGGAAVTSAPFPSFVVVFRPGYDGHEPPKMTQQLVFGL